MKTRTKWVFIVAGWLALIWQAFVTLDGGVIACAAIVTLVVAHEAQQERANQAAEERRKRRNAKHKERNDGNA